MQATVARFDSVDRSGSVLLDDGQAMTFSRAVFAASGLRLLRVGQRLRITLDARGEIESLAIVTFPLPH